MNRSRGVAAAVALALALHAEVAVAFCRTTTVAVVADFQPSLTRCWTEGLPLYWRNPCVGYGVQRNASGEVGFDDAANGISQAFLRWTRASCPSTGSRRSRTSIDVRDLGAISCGEIGYNQSGANQNVIVFRDDTWPHSQTDNTLALTTVTFNPNTGEIYDADMEINTHGQNITLVEPVPPGASDFASIVTHEAGHFLGLAHSGVRNATMYASYTPSSTAMRELTSDDVAGICVVYRPDGARPVTDAGETGAPMQCDPSPRRGFTSECAEPPKRTCMGSSQVAAGQPMASGGLLVFVSVAAALGTRRRRSV